MQENINEFGMTASEAEADALVQFAEFDLSGVVMASAAAGHPVLSALAALAPAVAEGDETAQLDALAALSAALLPAGEGAAAARAVAAAQGAVRELTLLAATASGADAAAAPGAARAALAPALLALRRLCTGGEAAPLPAGAAPAPVPVRSLVTINFAGVIAHVVAAAPYAATADAVAAEIATANTAATDALALAALLCRGREDFKVALYELGVPRLVAAHLELASREGTAEPALALVQHGARATAGCAVVAAMLSDDDMSVEASKAFAMARSLACEHPASGESANDGPGGAGAGAVIAPQPMPMPGESAGLGLVAKLLSLLRVFGATAAPSLEALGALRAIIVTSDICREADRCGAVSLVTGAVAGQLEVLDSMPAGSPPPAASLRALRGGLAVLRALAGCDEVKAHIGTGAPLSAAIACVAACARLPADPATSAAAAEAASALAAMTLRAPGTAAAAANAGALTALAAVMRSHSASARVQRAAAMATRNLVVRSPARADAAREAGIESALQTAYAMHPTARDVVYAALRDMGCDYAITERGAEQAARAARAIAAGDISVK